MIQFVALLTCDRCGVKAEVPIESGHAPPFPDGWATLLQFGVTDRSDVWPLGLHCDQCVKELVRIGIVTDPS